MPSGTRATIQQLAGGSKWHCPDVKCRYVDAADLELDGPTKVVVWDGQRQRLRDAESQDETVRLSDVCNVCRHAKGWSIPWSSRAATDDDS
jgi:hypothetical protein